MGLLRVVFNKFVVNLELILKVNCGFSLDLFFVSFGLIGFVFNVKFI